MKPAHAPAICPLCHCTVMVWKHGKLSASLLRALALAEHVKVLHPVSLKRGEPTRTLRARATLAAAEGGTK